MGRPKLRVLSPRIDVVSAFAVGSAWGFLSVVFFAQPDPFRPIAFIDYLAVVSFSVALAALALAAWLITGVVGRTMVLHRRTAVAALAPATIFGALTFQDGGLGVAVAAWLVAGVAVWRGPGSVVRGSAIITVVSGPVAGIGNLIEDGFGLKDVGGAIFVTGLGGSLIGLIGLTIALALGGRLALAGLCAATLVGMAASTQYGGGLVILAVWFGFAAWIRRRPTSLTTA